MDDSLHKKINSAIRLIQSAANQAKERFGEKLEVSYSGGKDSDVILELAKMASVDFIAIYKCTTIDPPYTIKHAEENGALIIRPKMNFPELLAYGGFPNWRYRFCCNTLKEYKVLNVAILGVRACESNARKERYKEPTQCRVYSKTSEVQQYFPILNWTNEDCLNFIKEREIKLHPLYYNPDGSIDMSKRLGCMCCPLTGERLRREQFAEHPNMLKLYLRGGRMFLEQHKDSVKQKYGDEYRWLVRDLFFRSDEEFYNKIGGGIFGEQDCKALLENYFKVKL